MGNVTFNITRARQDGEVQYLTPDRRWTAEAEFALELTMRTEPTVVEQAQIDAGCHRILGLRSWLELEQTTQDAWGMLLARYMVEAYPDGPPEDLDLESPELNAKLNEQFQRDTSADAAAYQAMQALQHRVRFLAGYPILVVAPPTGWQSLADLPDDPPGLVNYVMNAYNQAIRADEDAAGNG